MCSHTRTLNSAGVRSENWFNPAVHVNAPAAAWALCAAIAATFESHTVCSVREGVSGRTRAGGRACASLVRSGDTVHAVGRQPDAVPHLAHLPFLPRRVLCTLEFVGHGRRGDGRRRPSRTAVMAVPPNRGTRYARLL